MFSVSYFFIQCLHPLDSSFILHSMHLSSSLFTFFNAVLSDIHKVLSIRPSANVLVFQYSNLYHGDRLTSFSGTDRPDELCWNFSISNNLPLIILLIITDCDAHSLPLLDLFFSSGTSLCSGIPFSGVF